MKIQRCGMILSVLLALNAVGQVSSSVSRAAAGPNPGPAPGPQPGAGCSMALDKKSCGKEKGCLWCEGSFGPASCYDESQAKFLPKQFYKCKKPKKAVAAAPTPGPQPGAGCSMAMDKKSCGKEKGCLWCEGSFGPASCYDKGQAKFLPKQFYKCKKPKKMSVAAAPAPGPEPGAGCSMAMDKKSCGKEKGCLWCEGSFGPASCYDEAQAKFLPKQFYKCKKPKHAMVSTS